LFEYTAAPDHLLPSGNIYPNVLTVSGKLARENPEIVVEFVRQVLLAARWAENNLDEVLDLFAAQTHGTRGEVTNSFPAGFHKRLSPTLSEKGLLALESQKKFMLAHGYIKNDFDIEKWADSSFLDVASASIEKAAA
jgi:2'-hydroxybiphenyl-2-sulfinate desulfinase